MRAKHRQQRKRSKGENVDSAATRRTCSTDSKISPQPNEHIDTIRSLAGPLDAYDPLSTLIQPSTHHYCRIIFIVVNIASKREKNRLNKLPAA